MLVKSQVKYIKCFGHKKFRDQEGAFAAEGKKLVAELLSASNIEPLQLFAEAAWIRENQELLKRSAVPVTELKETELERISSLTTPNQVLAVFRKPVFEPIRPQGKISLLLDGIQDPGNMGTIIRTADWFGLQYIICSEDCADAFNPKVIQSTMGSIGRVQVIHTSLSAFLKMHPTIAVYATALTGADVLGMNRLQEAFIIIGNESKGIDEALLKDLKYQRITIPGKGKAESLNAAVATGIVLAHLVPLT